MSKSTDRINLTNQFLIAMPSMADPTFSGTVVYLCDHSERGALGLVINRPTDIDLGAGGFDQGIAHTVKNNDLNYPPEWRLSRAGRAQR